MSLSIFYHHMIYCLCHIILPDYTSYLHSYYIKEIPIAREYIRIASNIDNILFNYLVIYRVYVG